MPSSIKNSLLRLFKFIGVFIFLLLLNQICWAAGANLKFSIILDKSQYQGQEPVNVTFKLANNGKEPVLVNKRFYLNPEDIAKERRGEVVLKVISPSGAELSCKFAYQTGLPKSEYFELLDPGKEVISEYPRNLRGYFDFNEPGVYKIEAAYQNIFGKEIGLDIFTIKLSSESVSFKIIKE